jgi:hypothetical protein
MLVRPVLDEATLQRVGAAPLASLRADFRSGLAVLEATLAGCRRLKTFGPRPSNPRTLTGAAYARLVREYVAAVNDEHGGGSPRRR